jgi:hypothetical protein
MSRGLVALGALAALGAYYYPLEFPQTIQELGEHFGALTGLGTQTNHDWRPSGTRIVCARVRLTGVRLHHRRRRHCRARTRGASHGGRARARRRARGGRVRASGRGPAHRLDHQLQPGVRRPTVRLETEECAAGGARRTRCRRDSVLSPFFPCSLLCCC